MPYPDCFARVAVCFGLLLCVSATAAQTPVAATSAAPQLTEQEVQARYQNCPRGNYAGLRPGKSRFTKDPWVWAVTPQFAAEFCMPPEFVSAELKGAEAVAYKMVQDQDEIVCGWGNNAEVCSPGTEHRFEIYYKTGAIPKEREASYFNRGKVPSAMLINRSTSEFDNGLRRGRELRRPGAASAHANGQFGLMSVRGEAFAWPLGSIYPALYFQEAFTGLDVIGLEGASGFSRNQNWIKHGSRELVITVRKVPDPAAGMRTDQLSFDQLALLIRLPASISEQVIRNDQAKGIDLQGMARRALGASSPAR